MRFDWDDTKNAINLRKHGIRFETATRAFDDPNQLLRFDRIVDGEERWQTIGLVDGIYMLLVVHTIEDVDDDEVYRLISARKAERHERRNYDERL
jgi:uncharacterized DUF497 family protein